MAVDNIAVFGIQVDPRGAVTGSRKASKAIDGIGKASKRALSKLKDFSAKMGKISGVALVGFAVSSVKTAADFEKSMNKVSAIGGHTGETLEAMSTQAKELGRTTAFSASQAADAMTFLSMAGFDAQETMSAMPGVLDLAAASGTDLATSADIASNILSGLGLKAGQTGKLVDVMAKASASANMNVIEMGEAFKMVAPMADTANLSMEGMSAIIGKMADAGIKGTMAGTGLKAAIARLVDPSKETAQALKSIGVETMNSDGSMRNFIDILADMEKGGASAADYMRIFGLESGPKMMAATKGGVSAIKELKAELQGAGGAAKAMADTQLKGLSGGIKKLKSAFEGMQLALADSGLLEFVTDMTSALTAFVPKVVEFVKQHPMLSKVALALTAVGIAMSFMGGPITLIIGAIAGLTAAWIKWGDDIMGVWNAVVDKIKAIFFKVKMAFLTPIKNMMESVKALMDKAPQWMVPDGLVNGVDGVLDEFRRMEDEAVGHSIIPDMVDDIGVVMEGLESKMVDPAKAASDAVNESFKEMSSGIGNSIKGIVQGTTTLKSALRNIGSNALDRFTQRTVYDPLNSMIDGIDFSSMLSFAGGGSTGGGSRSGGVDGQGGFPALLHPNETVIDHTKGQSMGGQTTNVTINISGNVDQRAINQIKQVVASDPSMIHQLNENGRRTGASIGAR